jgi:hypothetical protein
VFCAYTFILWHTKTGGLRRRWASKPLNTFTEALEAFRTAMSFRASGVAESESGRILRLQSRFGLCLGFKSV